MLRHLVKQHALLVDLRTLVSVTIDHWSVQLSLRLNDDCVDLTYSLSLIQLGFTLSALLHSDGYGRGNPMIGADCTTITCHRYTPPDKLERMTQQADIVITATGKV